jgi:Uma2 family endonuclease
VSETSLDEDRKMAEIYGKAGIPVYWIVNLVDGQVEVYSDPGPSGYRSHEVLAPGHALRVMIDGVEVGEIPVADILP